MAQAGARKERCSVQDVRPGKLEAVARALSTKTANTEVQRAGSNSCSSGKGGVAETREEQSRNNTAAVGQGPGSMSRGT